VLYVFVFHFIPRILVGAETCYNSYIIVPISTTTGTIKISAIRVTVIRVVTSFSSNQNPWNKMKNKNIQHCRDNSKKYYNNTDIKG
jgi:hypothetical protein